MNGTVLIAHGEDHIRKLVDLTLNPDPKNPTVKVIGVANGPKAMEQASKHRPDVAVLCTQLPIVDGFGVAEYILGHSELKGRTRVILITTEMDMTMDLVRASSLEVHGMIRMPFEKGVLRAAIEKGLPTHA